MKKKKHEKKKKESKNKETCQKPKIQVKWQEIQKL